MSRIIKAVIEIDEDYIIASGAKLKKEWFGDIINMFIER